jgi:hypothetical protein
MKQKQHMSSALIGTAAAVAVMGTTVAMATAPCDDFGECKALIEMNTTDGDIGFHFLMDGDDLNSALIRDPGWNIIFEDSASGPLREQKLTETFAESAEPLCWPDPEADPGDLIVTLEEFLARWTPGTYHFIGSGDVEMSFGETDLTYDLPAAPKKLAFDDATGEISWKAGNDLGECATNQELNSLVMSGVLPLHPKKVVVDAWEVVFEPDVEDGDPLGKLKFTIRVAGDIQKKKVTVPADYLAHLPADTLAKIEVGAIGGEDNATFTEIFDVCVNEDAGCDE